jgi:hypothetical protein
MFRQQYRISALPRRCARLYSVFGLDYMVNIDPGFNSGDAVRISGLYCHHLTYLAIFWLL